VSGLLVEFGVLTGSRCLVVELPHV
jgi:hypothetical protein